QHSSADYYYHADALGSITRMTDQNGNTVQTYKYDSFGNITASSILQPYAYTGREYDKETGLYYYRGRYYDPKTGRFISKDPIGFGGGINVYVAMGNNPVNYMDPSGLFNPVKGGVALLNAANAGRLYAIGFLKLAAAAGFNATGVGAPVGAGLIASGYWNMWSGYAAQRRGLQQWGEALQENWCDAASRNLLGILPLGQAYDDSSEPTPFEYLRNLYDKVQDDPSLIWKLIQEFGTLGW
ncbi:MAG: hypothetical protein HZB79_08230, partial [Deltaproteobacteria bacterium]|nr:hypothetical protein [Deltaproteobacteria bacterium]